MKNTKMINTVKETKKSRKWFWIIVAFVLGYGIGYTTYYLVVNRHNLFVDCSDKPTCPDGGKPDKHGCCKGEVYTDAGGGWMVCCPDGGDNCFPPITNTCQVVSDK